MFVFFRLGYYDFRGDSAAEGESMGLRYGDGVSPPHFGRVWGLEYFFNFWVSKCVFWWILRSFQFKQYAKKICEKI